ncbi:MAG: hypothetical protein L0I79_05535, partial [Atopostipes sp.]|nr:hypothetical protein [Atopostipes sp.]
EREDLYQQLIDYIANQSNKFKKTIIYVDHYEHFSAQELELLTVLAKYSSRLMINLTLNQEALENNLDYNHLFYRPLKSYYQLRDTFQSEKIELLENFFVEDERNLADELDNLRDYWIKSSQSISQLEQKEYEKDQYKKIELWEAEDQDTEVFHIANKIERLVASGEYRYKDFQIMTRNLPGYELSLNAIFNKNNLPFFIDKKETMSQHPLLEFIVSLFSLKKKYYRIDDIFRFLRTELFIPRKEKVNFEAEDKEKLLENISIHQKTVKEWREKIDIAENVALAFGYQGADWIRDEDWHYTRFDIDEQSEISEEEKRIENQANEVREIFRERIIPFIQSLDQIKTNKELAHSLYQFMEDIQLINSLEFWRNQLIAQGALEEAEKHEQAWDTFIAILDEFVEVLGDEAWDLDNFLAIIEAGFDEATYSMLPPTIDQVLITDYDLPKIQAKKIVFLMGLTDSQLPEIEENKSLLTDEDRERVEDALDSEKYLAASGIESTANEPFGFYLTLLQANEKIYFTYPSTNDEHKENRISPYLRRIKDSFSLPTKIKYRHSISIPKGPLEAFDYLEYITSENQVFGEIVIHLRYALDNLEKPPAFWVGLYNQLYRPRDLKQNRVLKSLSHRNIPVALDEDLAKDLYGENLYLSVSQLESFYTDPFSHFLIYGLRL